MGQWATAHLVNGGGRRAGAGAVRATLTKFKMETDDSDYHLVLGGEQGHTMITEIPSTDCIGSSPFKSAIGDVRAVFFTRFHPGPSFRAANTPITLTGVGFFDRVHGQTGGAANGIELHRCCRSHLADHGQGRMAPRGRRGRAVPCTGGPAWTSEEVR